MYDNMKFMIFNPTEYDYKQMELRKWKFFDKVFL